ncbi:flavodoxin-dependent (E)-4-hydroxy-3-methylbut-2-enyl-diphosphate synthase [Hathewaya massiliensis]|uniref:flavodoxin-dependent (E)-4-hydroxy-3-methylbut-2-enyl-diphosphate synthase n=1 Tax=Hathewaya massiliensis TaxID=1964382 RepID=UPI00242F40F4|nr:flavodoxin-dependent (E)-4-hydroxy-3-methylbut-2-enyl-diphosphate synthase [Hathewaya massiliensis]
MNRRKTKEVKVGNIMLGGDNPIAVQSMTNTDTRDIEKTIEQIKELESVKCDIVRCAVPDKVAAEAIKDIVSAVNIPVVADIHFDYRLALKSIENGVSAVRINPGNIGNEERIREVVEAAKHNNIPIRIGVNSGSLEKDILEKYGAPTAEALVESALKNIELLEKYSFHDIVISIKSSDVFKTIKGYRLLSSEVDYPLHLGVTEAGTIFSGTVKSSVGIGTLLSEGIGDTLRVSLTGDVKEEIKVGREILKSLGYINEGIKFVSCPTCGRTQINLIKIAEEVEKRLKDVNKNIKVAVMGCAVNGPGEARDADIGIAGGNGEGLIFKKGVIIKKVKEENLIEELINEVNKF